MSFPDTRHTLIRRIATDGDEASWREFLADYWEPICRFIARRGNLKPHDAEDVAAQVFETFLRNRLLQRWSDAPVAKLRTLICTVVRNALSNQARVLTSRAKLLAERPPDLPEVLGGDLESTADAASQADVFYADWVDELLRTTANELMLTYNQEGRGDYFRVLYSRLCEELSMTEISELLDIKPATADNYFRHARQRLMERLQQTVREHVLRYSTSQSEEADFKSEWSELGSYLQNHGGLEESVRRAYQEFDPAHRLSWQSRVAAGTLSLTSLVKPVLGSSSGNAP